MNISAPLKVCGLALALCANNLHSQSGAQDLILNTETFFSVARIIGNPVDDRYVIAEETSFRPTRSKDETQITSVITYAIDCAGEKGIFEVSSAFNLEQDPKEKPRWGISKAEGVGERFRVQDLKYSPLQDQIAKQQRDLEESIGRRIPTRWPNRLAVLVAYSCQTAGRPEFGPQIAAQIRKTGGLSNIKELRCNILIEGHPERSIFVRFHDELKIVQHNEQWKLRPIVNDLHVGFDGTDGMSVIIDRGSGKYSGSMRGLDVASGTCDLAENYKPRF